MDYILNFILIFSFGSAFGFFIAVKLSQIKYKREIALILTKVRKKKHK